MLEEPSDFATTSAGFAQALDGGSPRRTLAVTRWKMWRSANWWVDKIVNKPTHNRRYVADDPGVNSGPAHEPANVGERDDPDDGVHAVDVLVGDLQGATDVALKFKDRGSFRVPYRFFHAQTFFVVPQNVPMLHSIEKRT
ncbi:hypothetical protein EVAR_97792_1 [Eumeta japonica]|uniref:Uncharacterized protein n=1 Tax=Eumeta variegata TaxID=151549 RepID=A0A4C1XDY5_EUMVA|nr:hypothetical protein EVAR_97792_1 [Eumeta japonica]